MKLTVTLRDSIKNKDIRKEGLIPCIIYGKYIKTPLVVSCIKNDIIKKYKEVWYATPFTLEGENIKELVLIQDIQLDPVSDVLLHVDFLAIKADEMVITKIPIILIGESPLEKSGDGIVQLVKDDIEVEALPQDLPNNITVDIASIEDMNDIIFVKDLKLSDKITILDDPEQAIVTTMSTQVEEEVEEEITEGEEETPNEDKDGKTDSKDDETKDSKKE